MYNAKVATKLAQDANFMALYLKAQEAGVRALTACQPTPMVVEQHHNQLDDNSPVEKQWFVPGGVCGFAWIKVKPANSAFAKFLLKQGLAKVDSYYGGVTIWVSAGGQSYERKSAYAAAFAKVLGDVGISAANYSRLD